jgi:uncharacterized protein YbcI
MQEEHATGHAGVAVSNRAVQLIRQYTGRGATQARTTIDRDHVVIVMRDTLATNERTLADHGYGELVLDARRAVQEILRPELVAFIEEQFGRPVIGFMSANQIDPDLAAEIFVLAPAGATGPSPAAA